MKSKSTRHEKWFDTFCGHAWMKYVLEVYLWTDVVPPTEIRSDKDSAAARSLDLLKNFMGFFRCVVHTL